MMTFKERMEIKNLLKELRETGDTDILRRASDFEIIQVLIQCAITILQKKKGEENNG